MRAELWLTALLAVSWTAGCGDKEGANPGDSGGSADGGGAGSDGGRHRVKGVEGAETHHHHHLMMCSTLHKIPPPTSHILNNQQQPIDCMIEWTNQESSLPGEEAGYCVYCVGSEGERICMKTTKLLQ